MKVYVVSSKMTIQGVYTTKETAEMIRKELVNNSCKKYSIPREYFIDEIVLDEFPKLIAKIKNKFTYVL